MCTVIKVRERAGGVTDRDGHTDVNRTSTRGCSATSNIHIATATPKLSRALTYTTTLLRLNHGFYSTQQEQLWYAPLYLYSIACIY